MCWVWIALPDQETQNRSSSLFLKKTDYNIITCCSLCSFLKVVPGAKPDRRGHRIQRPIVLLVFQRLRCRLRHVRRQLPWANPSMWIRQRHRPKLQALGSANRHWPEQSRPRRCVPRYVVGAAEVAPALQICIYIYIHINIFLLLLLLTLLFARTHTSSHSIYNSQVHKSRPPSQRSAIESTEPSTLTRRAAVQTIGKKNRAHLFHSLHSPRPPPLPPPSFAIAHFKATRSPQLLYGIPLFL